MQQSIHTLKGNTDKNEKTTKSNIKVKTNENTFLIKELTELRLIKKNLENELEAKKLIFEKLDREVRRTRD